MAEDGAPSCPECGTTLPSQDTKTCPQCQHPLKRSKPDESEQPQQQETSDTPDKSDASDDDSDDSSITVPHETNNARCQEGERHDCEPFERKDVSAMVEHPPGSNQWYQAWFMKESTTEFYVRFPGVKAKNKPDRLEWVDKRSTRLWRGPMAPRYWKYIKKSDGMWIPKSEDELAGRKQGGRGGGRGGRKAAAGRGRKRKTAEEDDSVDVDASAEQLVPLAEWYQNHFDSLNGLKLPGGGPEAGHLEPDALKRRLKSGISKAAGRSKKQQKKQQKRSQEEYSGSDFGEDSQDDDDATNNTKNRGENFQELHTKKNPRSSPNKKPNGSGVKKIVNPGSPTAVRRTQSGPTSLNNSPQKLKQPVRPPTLLEEDDLFGGGGSKKKAAAPTVVGGGVSTTAGAEVKISPATSTQQQLPMVSTGEQNQEGKGASNGPSRLAVAGAPNPQQ